MSAQYQGGRWTAADETMLKGLQQRKEMFEKRHAGALGDWVRDYLDEEFVGRYVPILRAHAGELRDLLEPFDTGERAAQQTRE